jgi:putative addiction module component (TIGR02574 family)
VIRELIHPPDAEAADQAVEVQPSQGGEPGMSQTLKQLGIDRLSTAERIELIGEIWDSIAEAGEELPLPEWHRSEVERRRIAADADPEAGIPWEVVKARLANRP